MVFATILGFPRIGAQRELKKAVESFWKGESSPEALMKTAEELCLRHWKLQKDAGIDHIPSNDFSFYDQVLDMTCVLGAFPDRFKPYLKDGRANLDAYFKMARGSDKAPAMEMTKWFDTNYHYLVPEFTKDMNFKLSSDKPFNDYTLAKKAGYDTRPVLIGPVTYLYAGKKMDAEKYCRCETFLPRLMPVYIEVLKKLQALGATWVQMDEPVLAVDIGDGYKTALKDAYAQIAKEVPGLKIMLTTYFDGLRDNEDLAFSLPVAGIHIDLCRTEGKSNTGANKLDKMVDGAISKAGDKILSLGIVDGRNIWKNDLSASIAIVEKAAAKLGKDKIFVAGSCSLLHSPVDLANETKLDSELKSWMAFATQKVAEIVTISKGVNQGQGAVKSEIAASDAAQASRKSSKRIHDANVQNRMNKITPDMASRKSPFSARQKLQHAALNLPLFPTTSIGSFPQTETIRKARAEFKAGKINESAYETAMKAEIKAVVDYQHGADIDVLVHGEPERNDMVEYFGEQLAGFAFTQNGWVQSYGSRCVKPPVIFGDVSRPKPMTVKWAQYAQSLTQKVMKGMLTGPITILQWSFVRDDQPRNVTAKQIALAIRDEVVDLEKAGIRMIQIDEAAIREGLPLRKSDWKAYLDSAVENFRLSASGVEDKTQIHTHMCYSDFNSIIDSIADMDADVITIETSRSHMELLDAFVKFKYPNEIGPGVYDIHSPRIPTKDEMVTLLEKAAKVIDARQLWVNPDCGLKTRGWKEVEPALKNMVAAAKDMRTKFANVKAA